MEFMEAPEKRWVRDQFALVAVTTDTELGVATPSMVWGAGALGGVLVTGGAVPPELPPPQPAMRHMIAAKPATLRA